VKTRQLLSPKQPCMRRKPPASCTLLTAWLSDKAGGCERQAAGRKRHRLTLRMASLIISGGQGQHGYATTMDASTRQRDGAVCVQLTFIRSMGGCAGRLLLLDLFGGTSGCFLGRHGDGGGVGSRKVLRWNERRDSNGLGRPVHECEFE
jgi:hypothetical protein